MAGGKSTSGKTLLAETVSDNMISPEIKCVEIIIISTCNLERFAYIAYNQAKFSCREKLLRLQHENKTLRLNQRGPRDDKLSVELDELREREKQFCMENR